jgi:hypothetical protein
VLASPRYHVATVEGYATERGNSRSGGAGLSAHVIDRPNAARVVATFRSEEPLRRKDWRDRPGKGFRLGNAGALAAAEALAEKWNADEAR